MPDTKKPQLQRFSGMKSQIKVSSWLSLFEVAAKTLKITDDPGKIGLLMEYLEGEALQWYADELAPNMETLTWTTANDRMKNRFGERTIDPVLAAQRRRFTPKVDSVQSYFEDKMFHLRKTKLEEPSMAELLTDGMPHYFRTPLIAANVSNTSDWLNRAVRLESSFSTRTPFQESIQGPRQVSVNMVDKRPNKPNKPPPGPCKICSKLGKTNELHWHSDCPNKKPKQQQSHSDGPTATMEALTAFSKN